MSLNNSKKVIDKQGSPLDGEWIALDLETTGLSPVKDEIIEIGAVKFRDRKRIEDFSSFVKPSQKLGNFVKTLTGIQQSDVDRAPDVKSVLKILKNFIGDSEVIGHNIQFDINFLLENELELSGNKVDTLDLAHTLLPDVESFTLESLKLNFGIKSSRSHRALDDAIAAGELYLQLGTIAEELDLIVLKEIEQLSLRSSWDLHSFWNRIIDYKMNDSFSNEKTSDFDVRYRGVNISRFVKEQVPKLDDVIHKEINQDQDVHFDLVQKVFGNEGGLSDVLNSFEYRFEQEKMAAKILDSMLSEENLIVEAGTGVGKSLAYLIPSIVYSIINNKRVVISTNTINLQNQLVSKDLPLALSAIGLIDKDFLKNFKFCELKGRENYLCFKSFDKAILDQNISVDSAKLMSKVLVWLTKTQSGDRSEIGLISSKYLDSWSRISAKDAKNCIGINGVCFLNQARQIAFESNIVIVNHSLLISDIVSGGTSIPEYDFLIIDEGQDIEKISTKHFGFEISQSNLFDVFIRISEYSEILKTFDFKAKFDSSDISEVNSFSENLKTTSLNVVTSLKELFKEIEVFFTQETEGFNKKESARITGTVRSLPIWSEIEKLWEDFNNDGGSLLFNLSKLRQKFDLDKYSDDPKLSTVISDISRYKKLVEDFKVQMNEFFPHPEKNGIYWISDSSRSNRNLVLNKAPFNVNEYLENNLFTQKKSVVITGATLSDGNGFDYIKEKLGFDNSSEMLLGSPFDYQKSVLVCVPEDIPNPKEYDFQLALEQSIYYSVLATSGRALVLFTSNASLNKTARALKKSLMPHGINVFAQGIDGNATQVVKKFLRSKNSVLFGTSSLWEGVDIQGDSLKLVIMTKLPFDVPTDPIISARSEVYDEPFTQYSIPEALIKFRQGFGRLIRKKDDRGVFIILDNRIINNHYGKLFFQSLPDVTLRKIKIDMLDNEINEWLSDSEEGGAK